jgi:hypothetical protein
MGVSAQLHALAASYPRKAPSTHWIGGWRIISVDLDVMEYRNISCPCRESKPVRPARGPSLYRLSYAGSLEVSVVFLFSIQEVFRSNPGRDTSSHDNQMSA